MSIGDGAVLVAAVALGVFVARMLSWSGRTRFRRSPAPLSLTSSPRAVLDRFEQAAVALLTWEAVILSGSAADIEATTEWHNALRAVLDHTPVDLDHVSRGVEHRVMISDRG